MLRQAVARSIMSSLTSSTLAHRPQTIIRTATTSHCIPEEPPTTASSPRSSVPSLSYSDTSDEIDPLEPRDVEPRRRRASTVLISKNAEDVKRIIGESGTSLIEKCCGGGCCMNASKTDNQTFKDVPLPNNAAFRSLQLKIGQLPTTVSGVVELPNKTVSLLPIRKRSMIPSPTDSAIDVRDEQIDFTPHVDGEKVEEPVDTTIHPPNFVQPHVPYNVYSAKIFSARELTKPGAEKRTYHFDLDVVSIFNSM